MDPTETDKLLGALESLVAPSFFGSGGDGAFWREVWNQIRAANQAIGKTRFASAADRALARGRVSAVVAIAQNERQEFQAKLSQREESSRHHLSRIVSAAQKAWPEEDGFVDFLGTITGAKAVGELMVGMLVMMIDLMTFGLLRTNEKDPEKARLLACSAAMKEAWDVFKNSKDKMTKEHRDAAWNTLKGVQGKLDVAWADFKSERQHVHETRMRQFEQNRDRKQRLASEARSLVGQHQNADARARAKELFGEWRQIRSAGRDYDEELWREFNGALEEFFARSKEGRRQHIRDQIDRVEAKLERARNNRDANEGRLSAARSGDYANEVRGWIEQDEQKIEQLETWLAEWEDKLRDLD